MSETQELDLGGLPENKLIRVLRNFVIGFNIWGTATLIVAWIFVEYFAANDPTGWSSLGSILMWLYFGLPGYIMGFAALIVFWIVRGINRGTYRNQYGRASTILLWTLAIPPWVLVALIALTGIAA